MSSQRALCWYEVTATRSATETSATGTMHISKKRKIEGLHAAFTRLPTKTSTQHLTTYRKPSTNPKRRRRGDVEPKNFLSLPAEIRQDILFRAFYQTWFNEGIRWPHFELQEDGSLRKRETIAWVDGVKMVHEGIVEDVDFVQRKIEEERVKEAEPTFELTGRGGEWDRHVNVWPYK